MHNPLDALWLSAHTAGAGTDARASHSTELTAEPAEWVQLLPAGTFQGVDGRGPYHSDAEAVIRQTRERSGGRDLPIDYGHALEREGPDGDSAPAAAWLTDFEARNGEVWGRVLWTTEGGRRVREREYRFLSPVFFHDAAGNVRWLARAGLTNRPNLVLAAIHSQGPGAGQENIEVADFKKIAGALGLAEASDETAIVARCSTALAAEGTRGKVVAALQLQPTATDDDVVAAINSLRTPDPTKYVPVETHTSVANALQDARKKEREADVDAVIKAGKLTPAQRDWALSYHAADPAGFAAFAANQPVVLQGGGETDLDKTPDAAAAKKLTSDEKAVCTALNITEEDFLKNRPATTEA